jgi:hypothetical protein
MEGHWLDRQNDFVVLMNLRMKAERGVITFVPVCSSVAGMRCIISKEGALRKRERALRRERGCASSQGWPKRVATTSDLLRRGRNARCLQLTLCLFF